MPLRDLAASLARMMTAMRATRAMTAITFPVIVAVVMAAGTQLSGCAANPNEGWSTRSSHPENYRTVAVPIFDNRTYERDISRLLTDAVVKEIQQNTPYRVTSPANADTVLRGSIRQVRLRELSKSVATGLSEEMVMQVTVDFEWIDMRTGKPIVARQGFTGSGVFIASRPQAEPIDLGSYNAVQNMASDIVASMQVDW